MSKINPEFIKINQPPSPEEILNLQAPILHALLEEMSLQLNSGMNFDGTTDVLNQKDYPLTYQVAREFMEEESVYHIKLSFPDMGLMRKPVLRRLLTKFDLINCYRAVNFSSKEPSCFRFAISLKNRYVGDVFLIPILVKKTAKQADYDNTPTITYETLVVATSQISRVIRKKSPDKIILHGQEDKKTSEYFLVITDELLDRPELRDDLKDAIDRITKKWSRQQNRPRRR